MFIVRNIAIHSVFFFAGKTKKEKRPVCFSVTLNGRDPVVGTPLYRGGSGSVVTQSEFKSQDPGFEHPNGTG